MHFKVFQTIKKENQIKYGVDQGSEFYKKFFKK